MKMLNDWFVVPLSSGSYTSMSTLDDIELYGSRVVSY